MKLTKPVHLNPDCHLWVRLLVYHCTRVSVSHFIYYLLPFCLFLDLSFYVIYIYVFIPLFYLSTIYLCVGLSLCIYLPRYLSIYLSMYASIKYQCVYVSALSIYLSVLCLYLPIIYSSLIYLYINVYTYVCTTHYHLSVFLSFCFIYTQDFLLCKLWHLVSFT